MAGNDDRRGALTTKGSRMATYQLTLNIDDEDLQRIRAAGERIVLAGSVNGESNVAWVVFDPFSSNTVEWQDDFAVYASTTVIQTGVQIMLATQSGMPAQIGSLYALEQSMTFAGPDSGGSPGCYTIRNDIPSRYYPALTFGLIQAASVNGRGFPSTGPVYAAAIEADKTAALTPTQDVLVWLQTNVVSGMIVDPGTVQVTKVRFGGGVSSVTLRYDGSLGIFVPE
jgi:hypothetical protein